MTTINKDSLQKIVQKIQTEKKKLVIFGDVGIDKYTYGAVHRISPEAPVPVLQVKKEIFKLGLAANVANNLKSFNCECLLIGLIGHDQKSRIFESLLEDMGGATWGIVRDESFQTIEKERVCTLEQQICRLDYEQESFVPSESLHHKIFNRLSESFDSYDGIIFQDYQKGLVQKEFIQKALEYKKINPEFLIFVDPGSETNPYIYEGVDLLKPNLQEARKMISHLGILPTLDYEKMAEILSKKLSIRTVVITLGAEGIYYRDEMTKTSNKIMAMAKEVFDVSGAGDTVISCLSLGLVSGVPLEESIFFANCAASIVVSKKGTATTTFDEMLKRI